MKSILGEAEYEANLYDWKEEGLAEGRAEGERMRALQDAARFKSAGVSTEVIATCTGLDINEINTL